MHCIEVDDLCMLIMYLLCVLKIFATSAVITTVIWKIFGVKNFRSRQTLTKMKHAKYFQHT